MRLCDMHVHSFYSVDGLSSMKDMCEAAADRNLSVIAFTEHYEVVPDNKDAVFYLKSEEERIREHKDLSRKYKLSLLYGIELGQPHHNPSAAESFLKSRSFDFILGSVHYYKSSDGNFHDVYFVDYSRTPVGAMFADYFADMCRMVDFGGFDVLAHLDYPLRVLGSFLDKPTIADFKDLADIVLKKTAEKGIGLEISTRGLCDWQGRVGPEDFILRRFKELGGETVTTGSDAHEAAKIGFGINEAAAAAKRAGFDYVACFKGRKPEFIKIDD